MRIAQVTPLWLEVPPQAYGGTEYVVSLLTEELVRRGHDVTLFATANSKTSAKLVPIWNRGLFKEHERDHFAVFGTLYKELAKRQNEYDIIHDHSDIFLTPFSDFLNPPIVSTLHGMLTDEKIILYKQFPKINYVAISRDQKRAAPGVNIVATIHHGITVSHYEFSSVPEDYVLWLSNISPDKGLAQAIEIAKLSGEQLVISGPIFSKFSDYFEHRIKPFIDGKQIRFVGEADFVKKIELLKNAKAFLFPIFNRREPFGLVIIESLACGTPVVAANLGSMPELIENGRTGFLVNSEEEAIAALKNIHTISRQYCWEYVRRKFSVSRMVNRYEQLYQKILKKSA